MRYIRFRRWLADVGARTELIVYEQTIPVKKKFAGASSRELAAGFATRVQEFCAERGIEHTAVYPSVLKKFATGKGNADKLAMLEAVRRRWNPDVVNHNEADAIAALEYALAEIVFHASSGRAGYCATPSRSS